MIRTTGCWRAAVIAASAILAGCHHDGNAGGAAFHPAQVGDVLAPYAMPSLSGDTVRIAPHQALTLVNVWATWCTSCREEMADLDTLQHDYAPRGLRVVAVSVDQGDNARVQRFVEDQHLAFTVVHDPAGVIQEQYNVVGLPTSYLVDSTGKVLWEHTGNIADVLGELRGAVTGALGPGR
ncbi:MAG TPA: TlpA disulfide reductase family protein [Gemmatimonadales bacterium]|jgi:peroxiredoxin|nr:TlpA disulfide reductase family protein [Gemmatimonadales bacterium]